MQHYAVHDGPGIRTLVFLKGCPLSCAWCANPESQSALPEIRQVRARCRRCLRCAGACPSHAISAHDGEPRLDRARCRTCGSHECAAACPEHALLSTGRAWTLDELVDRVARDAGFYRNSGGGVTFSGGEPLGQPEFLLAALQRCRAIGIHTAVETCGYAPRDRLAAVEPLVDLFLYDLKLADPARHRALTGTDNAVVVDNLRFLAARAADRVVVRVPIVPGFTDDPANIEAIAALTRELGIQRVELCPYHALGRAKYGELDRHEPPDPPAPAPADLARIAAVLGARGEE